MTTTDASTDASNHGTGSEGSALDVGQILKAAGVGGDRLDLDVADGFEGAGNLPLARWIGADEDD